MPRLTLSLLAIALLAAAVGATYVLHFNPEMHFWRQAAERKLSWVDKMRQQHGRVIGVVGGSTTTFGVDADYLSRQHGLPVANLGLHAGMGPDVCTGFGFAALRKGDTLVVSLEPSMLIEPSAQKPLGSRLALVLNRPEICSWDHPPTLLSRLSVAAQLQPGGYHVVTMLGKMAMNKPLYRYSIDQAMPGGLQVTSEHRPFVASMDLSGGANMPGLSEDGRKLLQRIKNEADHRGINVVYVLPWAYWPEETSGLRRAANDKLLAQISEAMPVIREANLGVHSELEDFSDSGQHLTAAGAKKRSQVLATTLQRLSRQPTTE
ncbi:MAG: hypothetical protein JHD33_00915 [Chthoniobacterales bacterium]|nr:hypothetical protein [Chthoniobacterales bacterium]